MDNDTISRQAAIDAIERNAYRHTYIEQIVDIIKGLPSAQPEPIKVSVDREMTEEELKELKKKIADSPVVLLPSAQPEPLTDKEQRIFLKAMRREKDVCMAVDKEFPDAKVNLTDICREIVRKVKGALWE